jgi:hypothetical protein
MSAQYECRKHRLLSQTGLLLPQAQPIRASGHEIMRVLLQALGAEVRGNMGAAMAALMLNKPRPEVTYSEAANALHDALKIPDPVQQNRVIREGMRAAFARLSPDPIPTAYAGLFVAGLTRLDDGDSEAGVLTPTPTTRHGGSPARNRERILSIEVALQMRWRRTSRDRALQIATGVGRGNWNWTQPPTLPWSAAFSALQRAVDAGWEDNPGMKDEALAEGARLYRGERPSLEFLRFRQDYLRLWSGGEAALESCDKKSAQTDTDFREKSA